MPHPIVNPNPDFPAGYALFRPVPGANLFCPASGNCTTNVNGPTVFANVAGTGVLDDVGAGLRDGQQHLARRGVGHVAGIQKSADGMTNEREVARR